MANYIPVQLSPSVLRWLTCCPEDTINNWEELKEALTKNYVSTCVRLGTKHDLQRVYLKSNDTLRDYIRRFSKVRNRIPDIVDAEVITYFINGLSHKRL